MLEVSIELALHEWSSKHSDRVFNDWGSISIPKPAKNCVPEWFKETMQLAEGHKSIKACMPVTDVLTSGYMLPAPVDISVYRSDEDDLMFDDNTNGEFFVTRHAPRQYSKSPYSDDVILKFDFPWAIETPEGYSMLFMSPAHSDNSKLEALTAITETDRYYNTISCPVRVKDWKIGEVLYIAKGTPIVQAIPIKREEWKMNISYANHGKLVKTVAEFSNNTSAYKDVYRQKKKFT